MHSIGRATLAPLATALAALAIPAVALAHPSVYETTAKLAKTQEVQTITIDATGGTFLPTAGAPAVDFDATAGEVKHALEKVVGTGNVEVAGPASSVYTVTYTGAKNQTNEPDLAPNAAGLTGGASTAVAATVTQGGTSITFGGDPTGATLPTQQYYVIAEHGYSPLLKETNGSDEGGMLNLKRLPGTYRAAATGAQWLSFAIAQTDVQAHPVCEGVAELQDPANILLANENPAEPFWNYVPFTKTSAGIADTPDQWADVLTTVFNAHALNLGATTTAAEFKTACETGLGGIYREADAAGAASVIYSAALTDAITAAVAPKDLEIAAKTTELTTKNARITELEGLNATLTTAKTAAEKALADAQTALAAERNRPITLTLSARRFDHDHAIALVTGSNGVAVTVRLQVTKAVAKALGVKSTILGSAKATFDQAGARLVWVKPGKAALEALHEATDAVPVTVVVSDASGPVVTQKATIVG